MFDSPIQAAKRFDSSAALGQKSKRPRAACALFFQMFHPRLRSVRIYGMKKSIVAVARCEDYSPDRVGKSLDDMLELLGGLEKFVGRGKKVFVKPNLLLAAKPEEAVTTHPAVLIAVIRRLQDLGATVSFGDLPGGFHAGGTRKVHTATDMPRVAHETGAELVSLEKHSFRKLEIPGAKKLTHIHIPKHLDEVDIIVNVCKLKTHMQTLMTGAVKNMFGLTATTDRVAAHRFARYRDFAEAVADIYSAMPPALSIMDAVVGMEGTGPSQGKPIALKFIAGAADAVALDAFAAAALGFSPGEIAVTDCAGRRGMGAYKLKDIDILGERLENLRRRVRRPSSAAFLLMPVLASPFTELTKVRPRIEPEKCVKCRKCAEVCPAGAISFDEKTGRINDDKCILCFCCHELCIYSAVALNKPPLVKLIEMVRK